MNYITLPDKRFVTSSVLHVKSIPHESLFSDISASQQESISVIDDNREEIANLLSQVYQYYLECDKSMIAIEILWLTQAVKNQTYKASIDLFITTRAVSASLEKANQIVHTISGFCENSLNLQWYEYGECSTDYLAKRFIPLRDKQMRAVVKEDRMEPLPFQAMPQCYMFDKISSTSNDFRKIAGTLINYPESAVMIQLMPTRYEQKTEVLLLQISQTLTNIATGFKDPVKGEMKILTAQKPSALYSFYSRERNHPLFDFNVIVVGDQNAVMALCSRVAGSLNEGVNPEDRVNVRFIDLPADKVLAQPETQFFPIPWHVSSIIREKKNDSGMPPALSKLSSVITLD